MLIFLFMEEDTMQMTGIDAKSHIRDVILKMDKPFKLSQLFQTLDKEGLNDKYLILDVLNQLYENGLVKKTDVEDDTSEYESIFNNFK